jgi:hypothetical protein
MLAPTGSIGLCCRHNLGRPGSAFSQPGAEKKSIGSKTGSKRAPMTGYHERNRATEAPGRATFSPRPTTGLI